MFQVAMERLIAPNIVDPGPISTQETRLCRWTATKAATSRIAAATAAISVAAAATAAWAASPSRWAAEGGLFKGGLGFVAFIVIALIFGADPVRPAGRRRRPRATSPPRPRPPGPPRQQPQQPAGDAETQFVSRVLKSTEDVWNGRLPRARPAVSRAQAGALPRRHAHRMRCRPVGDGAVLLPGRPAGLSRPRLLRRPGAPLPCARPVPAGLRDRPRGRPSRPEPSGHQRQDRADEGAHEQARRQCAVGAGRAAGRLLRRRLGQPRRRRRAAAR